MEQKKKRQKPAVDLDTMVYGKVPPQSKELEVSVLGAIMLEKSAFDRVSEILNEESFYMEAHRLIYRAFVTLAQKSVPIDIITVVQELKRCEALDIVGGPFYITQLTNAVVSTASLESHARLLVEKYLQREIIRIGGEMVTDGYDESVDVFDLIDDVETKVFSIANDHVKKNFESVQAVGVKVINRIDTLRNSNEDLSGVPSGFPKLDRLTNGWQASDLIILAARPAVGKTAFALNLARNAAMFHTRPTPVAFFSLEMSSPQLVQRILSAESGVLLEKISRGRMEDTEYVTLHSKGLHRLERMPLYIDDSAALNIFEFRAKARRLVNKHKVGLIIIDYLQLMSGSKERGGNREQEISTISRNLKSLAKELNVPIIALSQLSRAVETRKESKMPQLSDLRESGAIEQDADMVMFLYRPEYYDVMNNEHGESTRGETHVRIAKHRNGTLDTVKLRALLHIQKFEEWVDDAPTFPGTGNWRPVSKAPSFDDGFNTDEPF
jgi:replicative DNA helicase